MNCTWPRYSMVNLAQRKQRTTKQGLGFVPPHSPVEVLSVPAALAGEFLFAYRLKRESCPQKILGSEGAPFYSMYSQMIALLLH